MTKIRRHHSAKPEVPHRFPAANAARQTHSYNTGDQKTETLHFVQGYNGQSEDASIGLYFYGARYYDPALARFVQADTIVPEPGNPQSLTLRYTQGYAYVLNNPLRYTDPSGMFTEEEIGNYLGVMSWEGALAMFR